MLSGKKILLRSEAKRNIWTPKKPIGHPPLQVKWMFPKESKQSTWEIHFLNAKCCLHCTYLIWTGGHSWTQYGSGIHIWYLGSNLWFTGQHMPCDLPLTHIQCARQLVNKLSRYARIRPDLHGSETTTNHSFKYINYFKKKKLLGEWRNSNMHFLSKRIRRNKPLNFTINMYSTGNYIHVIQIFTL